MRKNIMIIVLVSVILVAIILVIFSPKYIGKRMATNKECAVIKENTFVYIACKENNDWLRLFVFSNGRWKKISDKSAGKNAIILGQKDLKDLNLINFHIAEGGINFSMPLRRILKSELGIIARYPGEGSYDYYLNSPIQVMKNLLDRSGVVGLGEWIGDTDSVVLRFYNNFRECTYEYSVDNNQDIKFSRNECRFIIY